MKKETKNNIKTLAKYNHVLAVKEEKDCVKVQLRILQGSDAQWYTTEVITILED